MPPRSLTALLGGIIDYAGLFPPASLGMAEAVTNYASYLRGGDSWALGRFILPVARFAEFENEARSFLDGKPMWNISALCGTDVEADLAVIADFNQRNKEIAAVDAIELKATSVDQIRHAASLVPKSIQLFIEIPVSPDPSPLIRSIGEAGRNAKVRTGGVTPDAFPSAHDLARFIHICVEANVPFKATAGLHHPIRAVYNLTYKPESEKGKMYGYLNVFLAAAFAKGGMAIAETVRLLEEEASDAFAVDDGGISWRGYRLSTEALQGAREKLAFSFGSCSFREPMDELRGMNLL
jgi:hypothetical protein